MLARYFENAQNKPKDLRWALGGFLWAFGLIFWILLQPNLSNVVVLTVIFVAMLWINGLELKQVFYTCSVLLLHWACLHSHFLSHINGRV